MSQSCDINVHMLCTYVKICDMRRDMLRFQHISSHNLYIQQEKGIEKISKVHKQVLNSG